MDLKIYNISDTYCNYLRNFDNLVYDNKMNRRTHERKYVGGIVMTINNIPYYIPMSSPKPKDYVDVEQKNIKRSTNTIIRMTAKDKNNNDILRGTLRINNMIPVPVNEITYYDINKEKDLKYKAVVIDEINFINTNKSKIIKNALLVYEQRSNNYTNIPYINYCCDFKLLEEKYTEWNRVNNILNITQYIENIDDLFYIYDNIDNKEDFEDIVSLIDTKAFPNNIQDFSKKALNNYIEDLFETEE